MASVYADTSVLATRIFGDPEQQAAVEAITHDAQVCTCRYVIEEFRCTFLRDLVLLHALLVDSRTTGEALRRVVTKYRTTRPRGRIIQILSVLCDLQGFGEPGPLIERIEALIEVELMDWFLECVDEECVVDSTNCTRSSGEPIRAGSTYYFVCRCQKGDKPKCDIIAFYGQHRAALRRLAKGPRKLDKIHREFRRTARRVLDDPNKGRGRACTGILADAIIVLEAPPDMPICSTNASDFEPLCQTLGREFLDARVPR